MLAADWDGWANLMTEDVVFLVPNGPPVEGRAAVRAFGEAFPHLTAFTAEASEVAGNGGLAYNRGAYSFTATPDSGPPLNEQGKFLGVYRRQPDGSWRISRNIWNANLPPQAPAPGN
jgi:ketosteroid isomerase-like protein